MISVRVGEKRLSRPHEGVLFVTNSKTKRGDRFAIIKFLPLVWQHSFGLQVALFSKKVSLVYSGHFRVISNQLIIILD